MASTFILIIGIYMIVVGFQGHASELFDLLVGDLPDFTPWVIGVIILSILAVNSTTGKFIKPLLILIFLGILMKDWQKIKSSSIETYDIMMGDKTDE